MFDLPSARPALTRARLSLQTLERREVPAVLAVGDPRPGVSYTVAPGDVLTINRLEGVLSNDQTLGGEFGNPISASIVVDPAYITSNPEGFVLNPDNLQLNPDGSFTFIVPDDAPPGVIEFTYRATDEVTGSSDIAIASILVSAEAGPRYAVGAGEGSAPIVQLYNSRTNLKVFEQTAFESSFSGGVAVATGDINGDGVDDLVAAPSFGGGPVFVGYDGRFGTELFRELAFNDPGYRGGLSVAIGDVDGDGDGEVIVGAGFGGGPRIEVYDIVVDPAVNPFIDTPEVLGLSLVRNFFAFESTFRGGVNVAAGDVNGRGRDSVIVGAAFGGAPRVKAFDLVGQRTVADFFAFDPSQRFGVYVAAGNFGRGVADIVTGAAVGSPIVHVHDAASGAIINSFEAYPQDNPSGASFLGGPVTDSSGFVGPNGSLLSPAVIPSALVPTSSTLSGALLLEESTNYTGSLGGVRVAVTQRDDDGIDDIITGAGPGSSPRVRIFSGAGLTELDNFAAFNVNFSGGIYVGGNSGTGGPPN